MNRCGNGLNCLDRGLPLRVVELGMGGSPRFHQLGEGMVALTTGHLLF